MQTARQVISRIRWDANFGRGAFEVCYADRFGRNLLRAPLRFSAPRDAEGFSIAVETTEGRRIRLPLHRIRRIVRDGIVIWERAGNGAGATCV